MNTSFTDVLHCDDRCHPKLIALRRESHYGENDGDGDGDVTFRRSHFTFRTVTVAVSLT